MRIAWSEGLEFDPNGSDKFPDEDGVYVIAEVIDDVTNVRYVGQGNICKRMECHEDWENEQNQCLADVIKNTNNIIVRFRIIPNSTERNNIEHTFYRYYLEKNHPLCNKIEPEGQRIEGVEPPF